MRLLPYLDRAGCRDRRRVALEIEARLFERQSQSIQQAPGLPLLITDEALVLNLDHAIGQHVAPMAAQSVIGQIIPRQVVKRVSEPEIALLEHREAGIHGMAPQVYDTGARPGLRSESTNASISRTALSSPIRSSSRSGNSVA